jgi:hypothetical protein
MPGDTGTHLLRVRITAKDPDALKKLLSENALDLSCGGPKRLEGRIVLEAFVPEDRLDGLRRYPVEIDVIEDATAKGLERQKEVGKGNRFEGGKLPHGLGRKPKGGRK